MRISDWSSDVCSSDLCAPVLENHHFRFALNRILAKPEKIAGRALESGAPRSTVDAARGVPPIDALPGGRRFQPRGMCRRSEEHTSELQSLMRISYAVFCLKKKKKNNNHNNKTYLLTTTQRKQKHTKATSRTNK